MIFCGLLLVEIEDRRSLANRGGEQGQPVRVDGVTVVRRLVWKVSRILSPPQGDNATYSVAYIQPCLSAPTKLSSTMRKPG